MLGGFLIHLVLGTLYLWANITSGVTSYLRKYDPSVNYNHTIMVYASALAAQGSTMLLGGLISQRIGARLCCLLGSFILISGTFLASISTTVSQMIITDGIMFGIGLGLCYTGPISAAVRWLPNQKGLVTGIIVGGFGCGAFAFGFIATSVLNPHHQGVNQSGPDANYFSADSTIVANVPALFRYLGMVYTVVMITGSMLIQEPVPTGSLGGVSRHGNYQTTDTNDDDISVHNPLEHRSKISNDVALSDIELNNVISSHKSSDISENIILTNNKTLLHPNHTPPPDNTPDSNDSTPTMIEYGPKEILTMPLAWHLASCLITTTVGGMYIAGTFKVFAQTKFRNEAFLVAASSFASVFNSVGRIFWGSLADHLGPLQTLIIMSIIFAIIIGTYPYSVEFGQAGFAIWTFMIFFFEGANFVLYVPMTVLLFGSQHSASNYGLIFSSYTLFTVLNIFLLADAGVAFEKAAQMMGALTFIGFVNLLLLDWHVRTVMKKITGSSADCKLR